MSKRGQDLGRDLHPWASEGGDISPMSFATLDLTATAMEKGEAEERGVLEHVKKNTAHAYLFLLITRREAACGALASFFFFAIALRYNCTARITLMQSRKVVQVRKCLHLESLFVGPCQRALASFG